MRKKKRKIEELLEVINMEGAEIQGHFVLVKVSSGQFSIEIE